VLHFARFGSHVTMVVRDDTLKKTLSDYLIDRIRATPSIEVLLCTEVIALHGDDQLSAVTLRDRRTGVERTVEASRLFLCLGGVPHTRWAAQVGVICDEAGYIVTGPDLTTSGERPACWPLDRMPDQLETSVPGVFAAGDVRHGSTKRLAVAVGEGAMAAAMAYRYLARG
jgi:thioredoxin reductase (NADPH)